MTTETRVADLQNEALEAVVAARRVAAVASDLRVDCERLRVKNIDLQRELDRQRGHNSTPVVAQENTLLKVEMSERVQIAADLRKRVKELEAQAKLAQREIHLLNEQCATYLGQVDHWRGEFERLESDAPVALDFVDHIEALGLEFIPSYAVLCLAKAARAASLREASQLTREALRVMNKITPEEVK